MHSQTCYAFVDLVKLCSLTGPGLQSPIVAKRVNPTFSDFLGNTFAISARGDAFADIVYHGGLHLRHGRARDANVVRIPTKVTGFEMEAKSIHRPSVGRFGSRRHR